MGTGKIKTYIYTGPVMRFGKVLNKFYVAEVKAHSPKEAIRTIAYDYKLRNGLVKATPLEFPGKLELKVNSFDRD